MTREPIRGASASSGGARRWAVLASAMTLILLSWGASDRCDGADSAPEPGGKPAKEKAVTYIDLQPKANQKLDKAFPGPFDDNNLAELKPGKQTLEGLKFHVGKGLILLASTTLGKDKLPEKVKGIKIDATFARLHILHGTSHSVDDDTVIAQYVVHYADKSAKTIEVVYGEDVRDWWHLDDDKEPTRGKVAWKGSNEAAKAMGKSLWLFSLTWKNPHPEKKVVSLDLVSAMTEAAPFVVTMTREDE